MGVKNVKVSCANGNENTGVGDCWNDVGIPRGILFVDPNQIFSSDDIATIKTAFEAAILADSNAARMYPVQNIVEPTESTTDPNVLVFAGNGQSIVTGENYTTIKFRWVDGGLCLHNTLRKSKGQTKAFLLIDSLGQVIATDAGTTEEPEQFRGIIGYNYTMPLKMPMTTSTTSTYETMLSWEPTQTNENIVIIDFSEDGGLGYLSRLNGLFNVGIAQAASPTSTTITLKANVLGCYSQDLYDKYADELAVPGAWKVTKATDGSVVTVSAVTKDDTLKAWVLTLTSAAGLTVNAGLVGPTELDAIDVTGYDSNSIAQIIPGD